MTKIAIYLLLILSTSGFSQDYTEVDERVRNYPHFESLSNLSIRIQNDFSDDENRLRAAFFWIAHNIEYKKTLEEIFKTRERVMYNSEFVKNQQIRKLKQEKIDYTFKKRRGVCIDYSAMLNELCLKFGMKSISVIGILKTNIADVRGKKLLKNHVWNAVQIEGNWKLLDVTLASGYWSVRYNRFVKKFSAYHFLTPPSEFIKTHFPADEKWQLLGKQTITVNHFYNSPMFFTEYFRKKIKLTSEKKGIISLTSNNMFVVSFEGLPSKHDVFYNITGTSGLRKALVRKKKDKGYVTKIKLGKHLKSNDYLTMYLKNEPILSFKIQKKSE